MNTEILAIAVLAVLSLSGLAVSLLIAGLNRQLQIQRDSLRKIIDGVVAIHNAQCDHDALLKDLRHNLSADHAALHRIRIAIGDLPPDEPRSLGLTPTPVKLTPPAHDPEEEKHPRRRRRHHSHKGTVK